MSSAISPSRKSRISVLGPIALVVLSSIPGWAGDVKVKAKRSHASAAILSEHDRALHVLNRLAFGPRPGDIEKVMDAGVDNWIEQQLQPDKIANPVLDSKLTPYRTLQMQACDPL